MADKGARIEKLCGRPGCSYLVPSKLNDGGLSFKEITSNEIIAKARSAVERAIGRMKYCKILTHGISHQLLPVIDEIVYFCAFVTHFMTCSE